MVVATINNTFGSSLIGCTFAGIFYGLGCAQMYHYFKYGQLDDSKWLKIVIAVLWVLDTLQMILVTWNVYYYTISHAVSPEFSVIPHWVSGAIVFVSNFNNCVIRAVFVYRVWTLSSRNRALITPLSLVCITAAGFGLAYGVEMFSATFSRSLTFSWLLYTTLSTDTASDLFISFALFVLFRRMYNQAKRYRPLFHLPSNQVVSWFFYLRPSAHTLMYTLMLYSINTGILQSSIALAVLITYATMPNASVYMSIFLVYPKAAFNALLAILNVRTRLREMIPSPGLLAMLAENPNMDIVNPPSKPETKMAFRYQSVGGAATLELA
ncbi:hypothetical protein EIP91_003612 [Steccherinum ochraceum]|uniref:DUF6534 domain-containing protein n=1 Tax=Steccherinum ochraceum TaxID=92696 RepID=A0A4R0RA78_9APHY|nr:hypothetical protein EIP91_003612 [Steccherinum ochraceum]